MMDEDESCIIKTNFKIKNINATKIMLPFDTVI